MYLRAYNTNTNGISMRLDFRKLSSEGASCCKVSFLSHCPELEQQSAPKAHIPLSSFSLPLSSSLCLSRRTKLSSVEYSRCSGRSSGKQWSLHVSSKDVNKESLWHAQGSTGDSLYVKCSSQRRWRTRAKECNPSQECNHPF